MLGRIERAFDDPLPLLRWTAKTIGGRVVLDFRFDLAGAALVHLIATHGLPIAVVAVDTGLLFEESHAFLRRLEDHCGTRITLLRPKQTLVEQTRMLGPELWSQAPTRCCALRRGQPLQAALAGCRAWVSTAPAERGRSVAWDHELQLVKVSPLAVWSAQGLRQYVRAHRVPTPPPSEQACRPCALPRLAKVAS